MIIIALRRSILIPGTIALITFGLAVVIWQGRWPDMALSLTLPPRTVFSPQEIWQSLLLAGFSQIPLTAANAVIATAALAQRYWPEEGIKIQERTLAFNIGLMNLAPPFFGGMPMCHGAGGLAAKYYFGARTGGANIIVGLAEVAAGLTSCYQGIPKRSLMAFISDCICLKFVAYPG